MTDQYVRLNRRESIDVVSSSILETFGAYREVRSSQYLHPGKEMTILTIESYTFRDAIIKLCNDQHCIQMPVRCCCHVHCVKKL